MSNPNSEAIFRESLKSNPDVKAEMLIQLSAYEYARSFSEYANGCIDSVNHKQAKMRFINSIRDELKEYRQSLLTGAPREKNNCAIKYVTALIVDIVAIVFVYLLMTNYSLWWFLVLFVYNFETKRAIESDIEPTTIIKIERQK